MDNIDGMREKMKKEQRWSVEHVCATVKYTTIV